MRGMFPLVDRLFFSLIVTSLIHNRCQYFVIVDKVMVPSVRGLEQMRLT